MSDGNRRSVVGVFRDAAAFEGALAALLKGGFDAAAISVLGSHEAILDHFGRIPRPSVLTDAPDTPREALETETVLHRAVDVIAGTLAVIGEVGAAAAAYAVGGPVGVSAKLADLTDSTVEGVLGGYVDASYHERFERNVKDGGVICWVSVSGDEAAAKAAQILTDAGGKHVHETEV